MRLLDEESDRTLRKVALYLTAAEAAQVRKALDDLLGDPGRQRTDHIHIDDREYAHHLTLVVYSPDDVGPFQPRYRRLIEEDT